MHPSLIMAMWGYKKSHQMIVRVAVTVGPSFSLLAKLDSTDSVESSGQ